jgi:hypothetical protein
MFHLPSNLLHVSQTDDFLLHEKTSFAKEMELALNTLSEHACLRRYNRTEAGEIAHPPGIYLASGLFNSTSTSFATFSSSGNDSQRSNNRSSSRYALSKHEQRAATVLRRLRVMGFSEIYTREAVLDRVLARISSYNTSRNSNNSSNSSAVRSANTNSTSTSASFLDTLSVKERAELQGHILSLMPEQSALVDLLISRHSQCFLSSHYESSFSYMAQRMRILDRGQVVRYPQITDRNFGKSGYFKQWGV